VPGRPSSGGMRLNTWNLSMHVGRVMATKTAKSRTVRGGYESGSKTVSQLKPPPKTLGVGSKPASTTKK